MQIQKYMAKISGPLLDRIDLHIEVPAVKYKEPTSKEIGVNSQSMRASRARERRTTIAFQREKRDVLQRGYAVEKYSNIL